MCQRVPYDAYVHMVNSLDPAFWIRGGGRAGSSVRGIICPLVWIGFTDLANSGGMGGWGALATSLGRLDWLADGKNNAFSTFTIKGASPFTTTRGEQAFRITQAWHCYFVAILGFRVKVILIKFCGGLFLWNRICGLVSLEFKHF